MKRYRAHGTGNRGPVAGGPPQKPIQAAQLSKSTQEPGGPGSFARVGAGRKSLPVYVVELSLKLSPMPVAVQRKELADAQALYGQVKQALETGAPRVLELSCEKEEDKRISLLSSEVVAVQIYEKSAMGGGSKRPGFSFEG